MNQPRAKRDIIKSPVSINLSSDKKKLNQTIKFYNTVDDFNEGKLFILCKYLYIYGQLQMHYKDPNI